MTSTAHASTAQRLHLEWQRLRRDRRNLLTAAGWGLLEGSLDDLDQILHAVGYECSNDARTEQAMRDLVLIAKRDDLAARVVIQRVLPGLLGQVRKRRDFSGDALHELLGGLWIVIRTYNPNRDPSCLAAALIADADYNAFRASRRRRSSGELPMEFVNDVRSPEPESDGIDDLEGLLRLATETHAATPSEIQLLRKLVAAPRMIDLAADLQITPRTLRNRRAKITNRLRELAAA